MSSRGRTIHLPNLRPVRSSIGRSIWFDRFAQDVGQFKQIHTRCSLCGEKTDSSYGVHGELHGSSKRVGRVTEFRVASPGEFPMLRSREDGPSGLVFGL
jgi:hypothetical protein